MTYNIETIVDQALVSWLWSETDHDGNPLDSDYGVEDVADCEREEWHSEIESFVIVAEGAGLLAGLEDSQIGHDFTLTRNGHGAGFWDRGLGDVGDALTDLCKPFGEVSAYVGDDGKIGRI